MSMYRVRDDSGYELRRGQYFETQEDALEYAHKDIGRNANRLPWFEVIQDPPDERGRIRIHFGSTVLWVQPVERARGRWRTRSEVD